MQLTSNFAFVKLKTVFDPTCFPLVIDQKSSDIAKSVRMLNSNLNIANSMPTLGITHCSSQGQEIYQLWWPSLSR